MRRAGGLAVAVVGLLLAVSACSSLPDTVSASLDSASSATASASTVLRELDDGKALPPFADTVLGDALTELDGATTDLTGTGAIPDPGAASTRDDALDAIEAATDAVLAARDTVASGGDLRSDIAAVDLATDRLQALAEDLSS
jgi:Xaa-Pro aminopeptidase